MYLCNAHYSHYGEYSHQYSTVYLKFAKWVDLQSSHHTQNVNMWVGEGTN